MTFGGRSSGSSGGSAPTGDLLSAENTTDAGDASGAGAQPDLMIMKEAFHHGGKADGSFFKS